MLIGAFFMEGTMPRRFRAEGYSPEIASLMKDALDLALADTPRARAVTRTLLSSAVMDCFDAGVRDPREIADQAIAMLAVAENLLARSAAVNADISAFEFECGDALNWIGRAARRPKAPAARRPGI